ncbi:MAG TPA: 23S rRNA (uracil(1939)-C(5))-methyltransferase RlmD [Candidatus Marinimicrobia bacterium]|nr:23S rRNA (uracil(1939)-C(5))-methyltransferase RlmD [Candidatus Neomarinimicrobiota bacterium]
MEKPVKKHQESELSIEELAYGGKGLAHLDNFVIFVENALPGQRINARITKVKPGFGEAKILNIIRQSPEYTQPPCPYFDHCGGCLHQQLNYPAQLYYLHKQVSDLYHHFGGLGAVPVLPPIPAEKIFRYRNKMEFAFSDQRWLIDGFENHKPRDFALGLRAAGNFWKAIDLNDCLIAPEETAVVLATVREFALTNHLSAHNQKQHTGFLRHLVLRKSHSSGELLINIVTNRDNPVIFHPLITELSSQLNHLGSFVNTVARGWSGTTIGDKQHLLYGKGYFLEKLDGLSFKISPASFFQTNTNMAQKLYRLVRELAGVEKNDTVWDLYSGTGSIALYLAQDAKEVIGFEIIRAAVADARFNAELNHIANARFVEADLDKLSRENPEMLSALPAPDVLIIDPPRSGMHPRLVDTVAQLAPKKVIYVSCNPATQVRDIRSLVERKSYAIEQIQPLDMFPHTPHIEVVAKLFRT